MSTRKQTRAQTAPRTRARAAQVAAQEDEDVEVEDGASGEDMDMSDAGGDDAANDEMSDSQEAPIGKGRRYFRPSWKDLRLDDSIERDLAMIDAPVSPSEHGNTSPSDHELDELFVTTPEKSRSSSPSQPPVQRTTKSPSKPALKIRLKFNKVSTNTTPTPSEEAAPITRRGRKGAARDVSVESEDDDDEDEEDSTRSNSYAGPSRMTQRQAAMKGFVEKTDYVSLDEPASKRKKHLNETELALKREETARKRKNLSVKKLEDEKAETINRLLKKQSRPRGKRQTATSADVDEEIDPDADESVSATQAPVLPTLFRWVSSSKPDAPAFSFSVPASFFPEPAEGENSPAPAAAAVAKPPAPKPIPTCDVKGCTLPRKYKLVKNPTMGGCGMEHLKALQIQ